MSDAKAAPPALEAIDAARTLGGRAALDGATLALHPGTLTALLGASGAGKSTLVRVLAGLEGLDRGEVRADGATLTAPGRLMPPEARHIGVVFQDYALFPHLTAARNIGFGLTKSTPEAAAARVAELLAIAGLADRGDAYPHELSGGEQQRVALVRALANTPRAVLLDEPFSNLDEELRRGVAESTLTILKATRPAALLVTHHAEDAMALADELALMHAGRIIQTGAPRDVYLNPVSATAARLTGPVNTWRGDVANGRLDTPFGPIAADLPDGAPAQALARPDGVAAAPDPGGPLTVTRARPVGARLLLALRPTADKSGEQESWIAYASLDTPIAEGDAARATIDPTLARVIAAPVSTD